MKSFLFKVRAELCFEIDCHVKIIEFVKLNDITELVTLNSYRLVISFLFLLNPPVFNWTKEEPC